MVREEESLVGFGHEHVTATHRTTFEITCEEELSPAGSCIIAVGADKGARGLRRNFCDVLRMPGSTLETILVCGSHTLTVRSTGSPDLTFDHPTDLVWRRSAFTCGRTIGIYTDHTARDIPREMVTLLRSGAELHVSLIASCDE